MRAVMGAARVASGANGLTVDFGLLAGEEWHQGLQRETDQRGQLGGVWPEVFQGPIVAQEEHVLNLPVDDPRLGFVGTDADPKGPQLIRIGDDAYLLLDLTQCFSHRFSRAVVPAHGRVIASRPGVLMR